VNLQGRFAAACIGSLPQPSLVVSDGTGVEGNNGQSILEFNVEMIADHAAPVTVDFTTIDEEQNPGGVCIALLSHLALGCSESANSLSGANAQGGAAAETSAVAPSASEPPFELLDLERFARLPEAKPPLMRSRTLLMYDAPGNAVEGYALLKEKLIAAYWRELPGGTISGKYGSANGFFRRVTTP